jgi:hypothetical protein
VVLVVPVLVAPVPVGAVPAVVAPAVVAGSGSAAGFVPIAARMDAPDCPVLKYARIPA